LVVAVRGVPAEEWPKIVINMINIGYEMGGMAPGEIIGKLNSISGTGMISGMTSRFGVTHHLVQGCQDPEAHDDEQFQILFAGSGYSSDGLQGIE